MARPRLARLLHSRLSGLSAINSLYLGRSPSTKQPLIKVILNPFLWQNSHSHTHSLSLEHTHTKNLSSFLSLFPLIHSASLSLSLSPKKIFMAKAYGIFFSLAAKKILFVFPLEASIMADNEFLLEFLWRDQWISSGFLRIIPRWYFWYLFPFPTYSILSISAWYWNWALLFISLGIT